MTNLALAVPLLIAALAQAPDQRVPSLPQRSAAAVDLAPSTPVTGVPADASDKAFVKLFVRPSLTAQTGATQHQPAGDQKAAPKVVCGMVVIPANPAIDPRIVVSPPPEAANAKIRRIVPKFCVE